MNESNDNRDKSEIGFNPLSQLTTVEVLELLISFSSEKLSLEEWNAAIETLDKLDFSCPTLSLPSVVAAFKSEPQLNRFSQQIESRFLKAGDHSQYFTCSY